LIDALLRLGIALVHDKHGYRARTRGQLTSLRSKVAHVARRDIQAHASALRHLDRRAQSLRGNRDVKRVRTLRTLPHLSLRVLRILRRHLGVVTPVHLYRERFHSFRHKDADAHRGREEDLPCRCDVGLGVVVTGSFLRADHRVEHLFGLRIVALRLRGRTRNEEPG
jgi:hypothetical protein